MTIPNLLTLTVGPLPWFIAGLLLIGVSLLAPMPTIAALGFAGLITALIAVSIPLLPNQLFIWGLLSAGLTLVLRGLVPKESKALEPSRYARVCEPIPPGGIGRVQYQGAIWQARCQISDAAIAPESAVIVVHRQGNTLIVSPMPNLPATER